MRSGTALTFDQETGLEVAVIEPIDFEIAYSEICPRSTCNAFLGEQCVSHITGRALDTPHRERLQAARDRQPTDTTGDPR